MEDKASGKMAAMQTEIKTEKPEVSRKTQLHLKQKYTFTSVKSETFG